MTKRARAMIYMRVHNKQVCITDRKDTAHKLHVKLTFILKDAPVGALIYKNDLEVVMKLVGATDEDLDIMVRRYQLLRKRRNGVWAITKKVVPFKLSLIEVGEKGVA